MQASRCSTCWSPFAQRPQMAKCKNGRRTLIQGDKNIPPWRDISVPLHDILNSRSLWHVQRQHASHCPAYLPAHQNIACWYCSVRMHQRSPTTKCRALNQRIAWSENDEFAKVERNSTLQ